MYSLVQGVRLIHYWNKENEQCLVKICMRTVNITIYHTRYACIMKKKNAVFLRNKIYCELEGIGLEGLCKHASHTMMEKYVQGFMAVCTCM